MSEKKFDYKINDKVVCIAEQNDYKKFGMIIGSVWIFRGEHENNDLTQSIYGWFKKGEGERKYCFKMDCFKKAEKDSLGSFIHDVKNKIENEEYVLKSYDKNDIIIGGNLNSPFICKTFDKQNNFLGIVQEIHTEIFNGKVKQTVLVREYKKLGMLLKAQNNTKEFLNEKINEIKTISGRFKGDTSNISAIPKEVDVNIGEISKEKFQELNELKKEEVKNNKKEKFNFIKNDLNSSYVMIGNLPKQMYGEIHVTGKLFSERRKDEFLKKKQIKKLEENK